MEASKGIRSFSIFNFPEQLVLLGAFAASPGRMSQGKGRDTSQNSGLDGLRRCPCPGRITVIQKQRVSEEDLRTIAKKHSTSQTHHAPSSAESASARATVEASQSAGGRDEVKRGDVSSVASSASRDGDASPAVPQHRPEVVTGAYGSKAVPGEEQASSPPAASPSSCSLQIHQRCVPSWEVLAELQEQLKRLSNEAMRQSRQRRREWMLRQKRDGAGHGHDYRESRPTRGVSASSWSTYLHAFPERILTTRSLHDAVSEYSAEAATVVDSGALPRHHEPVPSAADLPDFNELGLRDDETKNGSCFSACGVIGAIRFLLGYYLVVATESERSASLGALKQIRLREMTEGKNSLERRLGTSPAVERDAQGELFLRERRPVKQTSDAVRDGGPAHGVYTLRHVNIVPLFSFAFPVSPSREEVDSRSSSSTSKLLGASPRPETQPSLRQTDGEEKSDVTVAPSAPLGKDEERDARSCLSADCSSLLQWLDDLRGRQERERELFSSSSFGITRRDSLTSLSSVDSYGTATAASCAVAFLPPFLGLRPRGNATTSSGGAQQAQQHLSALQKQEEHLVDLEKRYQRLFLEVFLRPPRAFFYSYTVDLTQPLQSHGLVAALQRQDSQVGEEGDDGSQRCLRGRGSVGDQDVGHPQKGHASGKDSRDEARDVEISGSDERGRSAQSLELSSPVERAAFEQGACAGSLSRTKPTGECLAGSEVTRGNGYGGVEKEEKEMAGVPLEILRGKKSDAVFNLFLLEPFFNTGSAQSDSAFSIFPVCCPAVGPPSPLTSPRLPSISAASSGLVASPCRSCSSADMSPWLLVLLQGCVVQRFFSVSRPRRDRSRQQTMMPRERKGKPPKAETTVALAAGTPLAPADGTGQRRSIGELAHEGWTAEPCVPAPVEQRGDSAKGHFERKGAEEVQSAEKGSPGGLETAEKRKEGSQRGGAQETRGISRTADTNGRRASSSRALFSLVVIARRLRLGAGARWYRRGLALPALAASFAAAQRSRSGASSGRTSSLSSLPSGVDSSLWWSSMVGLGGDVSITANQVECEQVLWRVRVDGVAQHAEVSMEETRPFQKGEVGLPGGPTQEKATGEEHTRDTHPPFSSASSSRASPPYEQGGRAPTVAGNPVSPPAGVLTVLETEDGVGQSVREKASTLHSSLQTYGRMRFTGDLASIVQIRGSVPLFWGHLPSPASLIPSFLQGLSPPFRLSSSLFDPQYVQSKAHFDFLHATYGCPVLCLDLVRQQPPEHMEARLSSAYRDALAAVNQMYRLQQQAPQQVAPSLPAQQNLPGSTSGHSGENLRASHRDPSGTTDDKTGGSVQEQARRPVQPTIADGPGTPAAGSPAPVPLRHPSQRSPVTSSGTLSGDSVSEIPRGNEQKYSPGESQSPCTTSTGATTMSSKTASLGACPDDVRNSLEVSGNRVLAGAKPSGFSGHAEATVSRELDTVKKVQVDNKKGMAEKKPADCRGHGTVMASLGTAGDTGRVPPGWAGRRVLGQNHGKQLAGDRRRTLLCGSRGRVCPRCTYTYLGVASTHEFLPPSGGASPAPGELESQALPSLCRGGAQPGGQASVRLNALEQGQEDKTGQRDFEKDDRSAAIRRTPGPTFRHSSCCCEILYEAFDWQHADQSLGFDEALRRLFELAGSSLDLTGSFVSLGGAKSRMQPCSETADEPAVVSQSAGALSGTGRDSSEGNHVVSKERIVEVSSPSESTAEKLKSEKGHPEHARVDGRRGEAQDAQRGAPAGWVQQLQHGVLRVNCVDCLDRTNLAMLGLGVAALYIHLTALLRCRHPMRGDDRYWDFAREDLLLESEIGQLLPLNDFAIPEESNNAAGQKAGHIGQTTRAVAPSDINESPASYRYVDGGNSEGQARLSEATSVSSVASSSEFDGPFSAFPSTEFSSDDDLGEREGTADQTSSICESSSQDGLSDSRSFASLGSRTSSLSSVHRTSSACCWTPPSIPVVASSFPASASAWSPTGPGGGYPPGDCGVTGAAVDSVKEVKEPPPPSFLQMLPLVLLQLIGEVWGEVGDAIALQYGGSAAMHAAQFCGALSGSSSKEHELKTHKDFERAWKAVKRSNVLIAVQRYFNNRVHDAEKQRGLDLFLGYFRPHATSVNIWSIDPYDPLTCYTTSGVLVRGGAALSQPGGSSSVAISTRTASYLSPSMTVNPSSDDAPRRVAPSERPQDNTASTEGRESVGVKQTRAAHTGEEKLSVSHCVQERGVSRMGAERGGDDPHDISIEGEDEFFGLPPEGRACCIFSRGVGFLRKSVRG